MESAKKTPGVTCLLYEARRNEQSNLPQFLEEVANIDPTIGILDTCEMTEGEKIPTKFGYSPPGSFGSYQLSFQESNFITTSSLDHAQGSRMTQIPSFPPLPLDDFNDNFHLDTKSNLNSSQVALLENLKVSFIEANTSEVETRNQFKSEKWFRQGNFD